MNTEKEKSAVGMAVPATESDNNTTVSISYSDENVNGYSYENMTAILNSLTDTLRLTREGKNIVSIVPLTVPIDGTKYVTDVARITYKNGHTRDINIDCDSGIAAVYDIADNLSNTSAISPPRFSAFLRLHLSIESLLVILPRNVFKMAGLCGGILFHADI